MTTDQSSDRAPSRGRGVARYLGQLVLIGGAYYGSARLGLQLALVQDTVTPLWPPTGIALVGFFLFGVRVWPGVAIAAFAANAPMMPELVAGGVAFGNTLAPLAARGLLTLVGFRPALDRTRDALALVSLGALGAMLLSASIGTSLLVASDLVEARRFLGTWSVWWTGDAMGILAVAPFLFMVISWRRAGRPRFARVLESFALTAALVGVSALLLSTAQPSWVLVFPVLGWAAWRFQQRAAAPAALLVISVASYAAARDLGSFGGGTLLTTMVGLQVFNAAAAFTSFFFAAIVAERERSRDALQHAAEELEEAVKRRTAELRATNLRLEEEVAERADAVRALKHRESQLAEAQQVAHIGSWEWDVPSNTVTWSDELYRIYGLDPGRFPATYEAFLERVHPEDRVLADRVVRQALKDGRSFAYEHRVVRPDGTVRVMQASGRVITDDDGRPLRMLGIGQDVTERNEAESALRESEEVFRTVFESASIGLVQCDLDGRVQRANPAFEELVGMGGSELRGRALPELVLPADRGRFEDLFARAMAGEIAAFESEQRLSGQGDGGVWVHTAVALVRGIDGAPRFIQAVTRDLTERKRAEALQRAAEERARLGMFFARVPAAVCITHGPDHVIEFANDAFLELGRAHDIVGQPARAAFPALDRRGFFDRMDEVFSSGEPMAATEAAIEYEHDGARRQAFFNLAYQPLVGPGGTVEGVLTHGIEVTEAVRSRVKVAESLAFLDTLLASAPAGFAVFDEGLRFIRVNERLAQMSGLPVDAHLGRTVEETIPPVAAEVGPHLRFVLEKRSPVIDVEIRAMLGASGEPRTWSASFYPVETPDEALLGVGAVLLDITERKRSESMLEAQKEALESVAREADLPTLLESLTRLAEHRSRGDVMAAAMIVDGQQRHLRVGAAPSLPDAFRAAIDGMKLDSELASCPAAAATRKKVIVADIATHPNWASLRARALADGVRAAWSAPIMSADGSALGTFCLYSTQARAPSDHELQLLGVLTSTAGIAMERDRVEKERERLIERERRAELELYEREHRIAETLQRSMLPGRLPENPDLAVAARYIPAAGQADVGGDWYDFFTLRDGRLGIVIGDVAGHGVSAAAAMGQMRVALRAYAMENLSPAVSLQRLNRLLHEFQPGSMATLVYAHLDADSGSVLVARAGHPPPLVLGSDGVIRSAPGSPAPPIGVAAGVEYDEAALHLEPGESLLLYTDGLIERRGESLDDGMERLRHTLSGAPDDLEALCDHLVGSLVDPAGPADDIAVLAVRLILQRDRPLRLQVPARPSHLPGVRRVLARWLRHNGFEGDPVPEIVLACTEACANAVRHAYDGEEGVLEVEGVVDDGALSLTVRDFGSWRPEGASDEESGRGMRLMQSLMDAVDVVATTEGTEVRMRRRARELVARG